MKLSITRSQLKAANEAAGEVTLGEERRWTTVYTPPQWRRAHIIPRLDEKGEEMKGGTNVSYTYCQFSLKCNNISIKNRLAYCFCSFEWSVQNSPQYNRNEWSKLFQDASGMQSCHTHYNDRSYWQRSGFGFVVGSVRRVTTDQPSSLHGRRNYQPDSTRAGRTGAADLPPLVSARAEWQHSVYNILFTCCIACRQPAADPRGSPAGSQL